MKKENIITKLVHLFNDPQKRMLAIYSLAGMIALGMGVYGYGYYQETTEKKVNLEINELMEKKSEADELRNRSEESYDYEVEVAKLSEQLNEIYLNHSSLSSGGRALYLSATIDYEIEQLEKAEKKFQLVFDNQKMHYLAPLALYHLVVMKENRGDYLEVIELVKLFQALYVDHYLKGEMLIVSARNYYFSGQETEADRIFQEILQDQKLASYAEAVQEWLNLIKMEKKLAVNSGSDSEVEVAE